MALNGISQDSSDYNLWLEHRVPKDAWAFGRCFSTLAELSKLGSFQRPHLDFRVAYFTKYQMIMAPLKGNSCTNSLTEVEQWRKEVKLLEIGLEVR